MKTWLLIAAVVLAGCGTPEADPPKRTASSDPEPAKSDPPAEPDPKPKDPPPADPQPAKQPVAEVERHELSIALDPATHGLEGTDEIALTGAGVKEVAFELNPKFEVTGVLFGRVEATWTFEKGNLVVRLPAASGERFTITVSYHGSLFDPPRNDETRFVTGEKSSGTIQPEGAFLAGGCSWYPDQPGSMPRFTVTARIPEDWEFVGQGGRSEYDPKTRKSTWVDPVPADRLECVAGPYASEETKAGRLTVRSFFFKEDAAIAADYRAAAVTFLNYFGEKLAPYPYDDFSIVENFFSTGYGMPSYTLLGRDVVAMGGRYLGEGGLGHEILHCWWGNSVFVGGGNWCEALTTYVANYGYLEATQGPEAARKYRRHDMIKYSLLVDPSAEYPVRDFMGKVTEVDNEVGYSKGSMIFHLVRRRIGEDAFWKGLRRVIAEKTGKRATWDDFRKGFEAESHVDLEKTFHEWLDLKGSPALTLTREGRKMRLALAGPVTALRVTVRSWRGDGASDREIDIDGGSAEWTEPAETTRVEIDPDFEVYRRLPPKSIPDCLNGVYVDAHRAIVVPDGDAAKPYEELLKRLADWDRIAAGQATPERLQGRSVLVLGGPDVNALARRWQSEGKLKLGSFEVAADGWKGADETVKLGQNRALLVSFANPDDAAHHATLFFPASPAATGPARLLLYYAWDSWLVWRDGARSPVARGEFLTEPSLSADLR